MEELCQKLTNGTLFDAQMGPTERKAEPKEAAIEKKNAREEDSTSRAPSTTFSLQ